MTTYIDSRQINLSSDTADQYLNGSFLSNVVFNMNGMLKNEDDIVMTQISVNSAQIPISYYNLDNLEGLYLEENNLGGELPSPNAAESFYNGLEELSIHTNKFMGRFPVEQFENTLRISEYNNSLCPSIFECSYWMGEGFHSYFPFTHTHVSYSFIYVLHMQYKQRY